MTSDDFTRLGRLLFSDFSWQTQLADCLGINRRTVERWANGRYPIPEGVPGDLLKVAKARRKEVDKVIKELDQ